MPHHLPHGKWVWGEVGLISVLVWALAGPLAGAVALYALGAALACDRGCGAVERVHLLGVDDVERAEEWVGRHWEGAVFGRLVPDVRTLISIPAGLARMPLPASSVSPPSAARSGEPCSCSPATSSERSRHPVGRHSDWLNHPVIAALTLAWPGS